MKCPNCGADNAEGKKFCGDCGAMVPQPPPPPPVQPTQPLHTQSTQPMYAQPTASWIRSNQKKLAAIVIVLVVVSALALSFFVLPMSGIRVNIHSTYGTYTISIDGKEKSTVFLDSESFTGAWPVAVGSHLVAIDGGEIGHWSMDVFVMPFSMTKVGT